ncbi:hypothetical protein [Halolamina pelagica]|uniref:hypothetical protein n=1 Tax=Halolamina pelagica TaxID=699431 RepID=UPI0006CA7552|nr:hypothetical protein [Halolamina pelagica]
MVVAASAPLVVVASAPLAIAASAASVADRSGPADADSVAGADPAPALSVGAGSCRDSAAGCWPSDDGAASGSSSAGPSLSVDGAVANSVPVVDSCPSLPAVAFSSPGLGWSVQSASSSTVAAPPAAAEPPAPAGSGTSTISTLTVLTR